MPQQELERLRAVNRFLKLEVSREHELQQIVEVAAEICGMPIGLITLLDERTQHIIYKSGTELENTKRTDAFCNSTIEQDGILIVRDAHLDERFSGNPLVTGDPNIRFYAGAPLTTQDGHNLGSLCVIGTEPAELLPLQGKMLQVLARQVISVLEFDASIAVLKEQFIQARNSEVKLRSYFESSSTCHLLLDREMKIVAFNRALATFIYRIFKVEINTGSRIMDYVHSSNAEEFSINCERAMHGESVQIETMLDYGSETIHWLMKYDPAFDHHGLIIGISFNATDITRHIEQERKVSHQDDQLAQIAFLQSHELRRPVSSILGLMQVIRSDGFRAGRAELEQLERAACELDEKIRLIVGHASR